MIQIKKLYFLLAVLMIGVFGFNVNVKAGPVNTKINFYYDGIIIKTYSGSAGTDFDISLIDTYISETYPQYNLVGYYDSPDLLTLWKDYKYPTSDYIDVYILFELKTYTINFYGLNNKLIETQYVYYDDWFLITYPYVDDVGVYTFIGWDKDLSRLEIGDYDVYAIYEDSRSADVVILLITLIMYIISMFLYFKFNIKWILISTILLWFVPIFIIDNLFIKIFCVIMIIATITMTFFNEREEF